MDQLLHDIGIAVIAATILGLISHWLRQPIILGYLIAGAILGPQFGRGLIHDEKSIEVISEIGLVLLLFIIGLEMNLKQIVASGRHLLFAGLGQFPLCAGLGIALFAALGYGLKGTSSDGLYFALMCGLSSTAIVVKLLYDKNELDTLPGRITLGVLVLQDVYAIFILAFQPNFANPRPGPIIMAMLGTVGILSAGFVFSRFILKRIFLSIADAPEMVVAVSIGWCASMAGAASALKLSTEMGALIAGLTVSAFPYSIHVTAKTLPLRDFFLTLFFMSLGMKITAPTLQMAGPVLGIVAFVILSRFLSVYPLVIFSGAGRRAAFISSLNLAQISEFSLVIASLGVLYGHITQHTVAIIIYAMALTAVLSSYAIRFNHELFLRFDRIMNRLRPHTPAAATQAAVVDTNRDIVLLGFHRAARAVVDALARRDQALLHRLLVVDFNPVVLEELRAKGIACVFGDISSLDTLRHAHLSHARIILSTIQDMLLKGTDNLTLVRVCRSIAPHAAIVATANDAEHEQLLRAEGAQSVVRPYELIGESLAQFLADNSRPAQENDLNHSPPARV